MEEFFKECQDLAQNLNASKNASNGCLKTNCKVPNDSNEIYLANRPKWIGKDGNLKPLQSTCSSTTLPYCSCMREPDANRYGTNYIALETLGKHLSGAQLVEAYSTCAVLVIGAGGLGSPVLMYLAGSGIGVIGVMDGDAVEMSNIHRQVIHCEANIGVNKAKSAKQRMLGLNSNARVIAYDQYLDESNVAILSQYDIIVDATDNPQTRYIVNDACAHYNLPLVMASCIGTQGQLMLLNPSQGPCFRCISPYQDNGLVHVPRGACSSSGVLGALPGIFGALQAAEILKLAAGLHKHCLGQGRMLLYDAGNSTSPFKTVQLLRNPKCHVCGTENQQRRQNMKLEMPHFTDCGYDFRIDEHAVDLKTFWSLYMAKVKNGLPVRAKLSTQGDEIFENPNGQEYTIMLIDSRPQAHYSFCHFPGAKSWPFTTMQNDVDKWTKGGSGDSNVITHLQDKLGVDSLRYLVLLFICRRGNASRKATLLCKSILNDARVANGGYNTILRSVIGGYNGIKNKLGIKLPLV